MAFTGDIRDIRLRAASVVLLAERMMFARILPFFAIIWAPGIEGFTATIVNRSGRTVNQLVSALDVIQKISGVVVPKGGLSSAMFLLQRCSPKRGFERMACFYNQLFQRVANMLIGYARVSTGDQNLDLQKNALIRAECELVYEDTASGENARGPGKQARPAAAPGRCAGWKGQAGPQRDLITLVSELQARDEFPQPDRLDRYFDASRPVFFHVMSALGGNGKS